MKPFFSDKTPINNNITVLEDDEIVTDPSACAEILNNFFVNSIKNLDIERGSHTDNITVITDGPVENAIEKFKRHPSITRINEKGFTQDKFSFQDVTKSNISFVIKNIDSSKSYQKENIPPKLLKENNDICALVIYNDINKNISKGKFPSNLKKSGYQPYF